MALGTVPSGDAHPLGSYTGIAAMTGERAAASRMQWTGAKTGGTPPVARDVHDGRLWRIDEYYADFGTLTTALRARQPGVKPLCTVRGST
jgi:hypothetical protein